MIIARSMLIAYATTVCAADTHNDSVCIDKGHISQYVCDRNTNNKRLPEYFIRGGRFRKLEMSMIERNSGCYDMIVSDHTIFTGQCMYSETRVGCEQNCSLTGVKEIVWRTTFLIARLGLYNNNDYYGVWL